MPRCFTIGSRGSKLALWQAEWVRGRIEAAGAAGRIEVINTSGDVRRDVPLAAIAGQGAFTKEIEQALLDGRVDLAVHSLKDLPTVTPEGLALAAVTEREDVRDALVLRADVAAALGGEPSVRNLPRGAVAGSSTPRRVAQLRHLRPDLVCKDLRGNVDTRLRKLDAGWYDAAVLASAGLRRLGLAHRISAPIPTGEMLPMVGQGALGVEARADDEEALRLAASLDHAPTRAACTAERALLRALGGGCQLPIAAHAAADGARLRLEALVAAPSGARVVRDSVEGAPEDAEALGARLARRMLEGGALDLLSEDDGR